LAKNYFGVRLIWRGFDSAKLRQTNINLVK